MARTVIVDGSNVAFEEQSYGGKPKVSNLVLVRRLLEERGFKPIIIVDASLQHKIDDPGQLDGLIDKHLVHQAPAGTDADFWVLQMAEQEDALVVSNDRFQPYHERFPWIEERRLPFMIIEGDVQLYEPTIETWLAQIEVLEADVQEPLSA